MARKESGNTGNCTHIFCNKMRKVSQHRRDVQLTRGHLSSIHIRALVNNFIDTDIDIY
jgi:hypothetical protein